jgi:hypothetical protein
MFKKELWLFTNLIQYFLVNQYVYIISGLCLFEQTRGII